jgi:hypothetical protein
LGARCLSDGTIHSADCPSSFAASWLPATSWFRASGVTVERSHANGSTMMRGCWGAMRADEEAKNKEREEI